MRKHPASLCAFEQDKSGQGGRAQTKRKPPRAKPVGGGAGDGGRTHTLFPATDFESVSSANSNTPAHVCSTNTYYTRAGRRNQEKNIFS